jgi:tetratricopeptide (TPR) repeat protein
MLPRIALLALTAVATLGRAGHSQAGGPHDHSGAKSPGVTLHGNLGSHGYRVTASVEAQRYFDQGLRLHWAFNHAEAVRSFREAERLDSGCGMCAWGVALSSGPNINAPMSAESADTAMAALGRARALADRLPESERRLVEALAARYQAATDRARLDSAYAAAMARVAAAAPDDLETATLLADAVMNLSPWNYWNPDGSPRPATPELLARLERVIGANPDHPGACHLYIHAVEAREPARAVPCAERLAALMPGAGHLVHMPAHIYIRVGRYADAVEANRNAVHADRSFLEGPAAQRRGIYASGYYPHNHHFLAFAASMMGSGRLAIENAFLAADAVDPAVAAEVPWVDAITPIGYLTLVSFGRWDQILAENLPDPGRRYTTGMAYYARGMAFAAKRRWAEGRAALDSVTRIAADHPANENRVALEIAEHALSGEIAYRRGLFQEAIRRFRAAANLEDQLPYTEPPTWYYPIRHSLGKAYLAIGRSADAERVYREDLVRFPENGWSLFGLAEALKRQRRTAAATDVMRRFQKAWIHADVVLTGSRY